MDTEKIARLAELSKQEPVAWMYQHEDTGVIGFVDQYQLDNGFEKLNPRLQVIGPLFAHKLPTAEIEQRTAEACAKLADHWKSQTSYAIRLGKWREHL